MTKKINAIFISLLFLVCSFSQSTFAAETLSPIKSVKVNPCGIEDGADRFSRLCSKSTSGNADNILRNVIVGAMTLAALLSLIFLIYGGFKWITSGGDKAKVEAARNMIIAAIVGLILTLLSYFILSIVLRIFGINLLEISLTPLQS